MESVDAKIEIKVDTKVCEKYFNDANFKPEKINANGGYIEFDYKGKTYSIYKYLQPLPSSNNIDPIGTLTEAMNILRKAYRSFYITRVISVFTPHINKPLMIDFLISKETWDILHIEIMYEKYKDIGDDMSITKLYNIMKQSLNAVCELNKLKNDLEIALDFDFLPENMKYNEAKDLFVANLKQNTVMYDDPKNNEVLDASSNSSTFTWARSICNLISRETFCQIVEKMTDEKYKSFIGKLKQNIEDLKNDAADFKPEYIKKLKEFIYAELCKAFFEAKSRKAKLSDICKDLLEFEKCNNTNPKIIELEKLLSIKNIIREKCRANCICARFVNEAKIIQILKAAPANNFDMFLNHLKESTKTFNDYEKAWAAFKWITSNIEYSEDEEHKTNTDTFKNRKTNSKGYAELYSEIVMSMGIKVQQVEGYVKGENYQPELNNYCKKHWWNVVTLSGNEHIVDSMWGSGNMTDGKFSKEYCEYFFCPNPKKFIRSHYPVDDKYQFLENKIDKDMFGSSLKYDGAFYEYGFLKAHPDCPILNINPEDIENGVYKCRIKYDPRFDVEVIGELLYLNSNKYEEIKGGIFVFKKDTKFDVKIAFRNKGKYRAKFYTKGEGVSKYIKAFEYYINLKEDVSKQVRFPTIFSGYEAMKLISLSPIEGPLKKNQNVEFNIITENRCRICILVDDSLRTLTDNNKAYKAEVCTSEAEIVIYCEVNNKLVAALSYPVDN